MNGVHAMTKKTDNFRNLPHLMQREQESNAQSHNVALVFAKLNAVEDAQVEILQNIEILKNRSHDTWLDVKKDIRDLMAILNTLTATLQKSERKEAAPEPEPEKPKQQRKMGLQAALLKIMEDGIPRHLYDINRLLVETDGEGWPEPSVSQVLTSLSAAYKVEKVRRGVYRLHPSCKKDTTSA